MPDALSAARRGFTVADVAARYRVGCEKVRGWINKGLLRAVNRSDVRSARPSWVIPPEALAEFEQGRQPVTPPKPAPRRRRRTQVIDFFPD